MSFAAKIALFTLMIAATFSVASSVQAETVSVRLSNGDQITGNIHKRSNADYLWLEFKAASSKVIRPIHRSHIVNVVSSQTLANAMVTNETDSQRAIRLLADGTLEASKAND